LDEIFKPTEANQAV